MLSMIVVVLLALLGVYLLIRLLEWDWTNKQTPNQEDPLFANHEEPTDDVRA